MKHWRLIPAAILMSTLAWGIAQFANPTVGAAQNKKTPERRQTTQQPARQIVPIALRKCRIKLKDQVTLASDRPGILAFVEPGEGDFVRGSQQIAGLKDEVAKAVLVIAEKKSQNDVNVRYSVKAAEVARAEHEKALFANLKLPGTIPDIEVLQLKLAAEKSLLQIEQARRELLIAGLDRDQAREELKTYSIVAPFDGVVTRVYKSKGEAVRQGDPILEMVSTRRVRVEGYVDISDVWAVKTGSAVKVKLEIPGADLPVEKETFEGRIVFVNVQVEPVTRQTRVWAEVINHDNILRTGLTATMTILPTKQVAAKN